MSLYKEVEDFSESMSGASTRRGFLGRIGKTSVAVVAAITGLSRVEKARALITVGCCHLAYSTTCPNCTQTSHTCPSGGCTKWTWYCEHTDGRTWRCGECYAGGSCAGCSCGRRTGF
jgi:hypothetical protein